MQLSGECGLCDVEQSGGSGDVFFACHSEEITQYSKFHSGIKA